MKLFSKKFTANIKPLLYSQYVLYFFTIISLFDLIYFLNTKDFMSFFTFIIIGFLTSFFSKNMIVILVIALSVTHILKYGQDAYVSEGFEDKVGDTKSNEKDDKSDDKKSEDKKIKLSELKDEYEDFQGIQDKIINNMKEINPLLDKAEQFIQKYEAYKNQNKETMKNKVSKETMKTK